MSAAALPEIAPQVALRSPDTVMRLNRIGSFFPTRLSFLRSLLRDMAGQEARVKQGVQNWDRNGFGDAQFHVTLDGRDFTLICRTSPLDEENRTDRVIATAWDACFVLFDGRPTDAEVRHFGDNAALQEAGRYDPRALVVSRANKSVRLFAYVVDRLAAGEQPDLETLLATGYLMRTTAVYGNGKFGMADRESDARPFRLEMLAVYMIREFTFALVEHVARAKNAAAVRLAAPLKRALGIGNSTGLGMAPFLVSHPVLLNNWITVRETALARVRALRDADQAPKFRVLIQRAAAHLAQWNVDDAVEQARIERLRADFTSFCTGTETDLIQQQPWDAIVARSETFSVDLQELVVALVLEPHGDLIDGLTTCMGARETGWFDPSKPVSALRAALPRHYAWALDMDLAEQDAVAWYVSEEKLEPRLGERALVDSEMQRMPHDVARRVQALARDLTDASDNEPIALFLARNLAHRSTAQRVMTMAKHPYGEVRDDLVSATMRPIDLLRCKLSFFGAAKFDPRSDRWTRIVLYQGAPCAGELSTSTADDAFLPAFGI